MTRTKTSKVIAIVLAIAMAFAFMSFSLTYVSAADNPAVKGPDYTMTISEPLVTKNTSKDYWYIAEKSVYEKFPSFSIDIKFDNSDATFADKKLYDYIKVYTDSALENELILAFDQFANTVSTSSQVKFDLSLSKMSSVLNDGNTYYLKIDKELTKTAANEGNDIVIEFAVPGTATTTKVAPTPDIETPTYTYGAPDINVSIKFGNETPYYDYSKTTDSELLKMITQNIKVYSKKDSDGKLSNEVNYSGVKFNNLQFKNNTVTFTVPLSKATGFAKYTTYYLSLGKELNRLVDAEGFDSSYTFTTKNITTTTTFKTVSTTRTVKAKSANTGDNANLPLWIGLAAVAALMMGAVYFAREKE